MDTLNQLLDGTAPGFEVAPAALNPWAVALIIGLSLLYTFAIGRIYQATYRGATYSQSFAQALMLVGTVLAVITLGIGGNVARALGLVAVGLLVRQRLSVPEPRDLAFLFLSMAVGMALGTGSLWLATVATLAIGLAILVIDRLDLFASNRPGYVLRVRVTNDIDYGSAFDAPFAKLLDRARLVSVESVQAGLMTELVYAVRLQPGTTVQDLMTEVLRRNGNNRATLTSAEAAALADD